MSNPISGALIKSGLRISRKVNPNGLDPLSSQERTLFQLLSKASNTAFGKHFGFNKILDERDLLQSFANKVPIYDYDSIHAEWWSRSLAGESNVTWKGTVPYYALSSGTTGAPSKFIPITNDMIRSMRTAGIKMYSGLTITDLPIKTYSKHMIMLGGNTKLNQGNGYLYGDLSGILVQKLPVWLTKRYKPGLKIASIKDYHEKMLAIAKEASKWDIGFISGIPSWIQMMLEYILEYNRIDNIHQIWPNLQVYAHGGTAFNPYKGGIQKLMGKPVKFLDSYLASEGFIGYQSKMDAPGMELNYNCGLYFEFIPFNQENFDTQGNLLPGVGTITIDEVEENVNYAILLSTCAGAWRYLIGDTVKFIDKANSQIIITGRTKHFLSICSEHLSVDNMNEAIKTVQKNLNINIREFTVSGVKANTHYMHKWYVSSEPVVFNSRIICEELDRQLKLLNDDYAATRKAVLDHPELVALPPKVFYDYMASIGKIGGQAKFPRVMQEKQFAEWEAFVQNYQL